MDKGDLRSIVLRQKARGFSAKGTVERDLLPSLLDSFGDNRVIILTGMRRVGKSTLLKQMIERLSGYCYVTFEDEKFVDFKASEFEDLNEMLIEAYGPSETYFFDEVQVIDRFEAFVRRLQDDGKKVILTGSNASLLSAEFGTKLTGRYKQFEVFPFSFGEYLKMKGFGENKTARYMAEGKASLKKQLADYLSSGSLPEYMATGDPEHVRAIYENILYRDVITRYGIRKHDTLRELVNLLMSSVASKVTYNSLKKPLGLSNAVTVKEYVSHLSNAYLFYELRRFGFSVKEQLDAPRKMYIMDPAFYKAVTLSMSPDKGRLLENQVLVELRRRGMEIYYFEGKRECDFVVTKPDIAAIQVCYELNSSNRDREIGGLLEAMKELKLESGLIITFDQEEKIKSGGKSISVVPAWKWFLENENSSS
jgi:uncharacterized protein